ncbi:hypothetical protein NFI96_031644 [Prochilodus magdalenae]|nr:hypothetical protein NFI96_031644 [Prochilodus magdalenae]
MWCIRICVFQTSHQLELLPKLSFFVKTCFIQEDLPLSASKTDMATIVKEKQLPDSGLEIRDQMWLKIAIANANANTTW